MIKTDRDAWLCDLAETYHILDITGLSILTLATLSFGLTHQDVAFRFECTSR